MKSKLLNALLFAFALLMTLNGCSSDETLTGDNNAASKSMKINVSDGLFTSVDNNGVKTRATDNGTGTTFASGDAIGVFAVKTDGTIALTNAKYTYDGTSWLNSDNTDILPYYAGAKYFAYYPYQASLASDKYDATQTTAETFFGSLISGWTPAADQSSQNDYTAQDLMVSMATVDVSANSSSFTMSHQMAMIEMDLHQVHYRKLNSYRFGFDAYNPLNVAAGKYRFLINPSKTHSITGYNQYSLTDTKTWKINGTIPAASKYKIYKYNGANAWLTETSREDMYIGDANIGDYLYDDGTTGTTTVGKTIVGIVFSDQLSSAEYKAGYTHGYALALQDASGPTSWEHLYGDDGLTKVTKFVDYYEDINAGYTGTFIKGFNKSNDSHPAWQAANNYNVDVSKFTNSGWYLPSAGQWWDVAANLGKIDLTAKTKSIYSSDDLYNYESPALTNINNAITVAGGTALTNYYWTASEYDINNVVIVSLHSSGGSLGYGLKSLTYNCVRSVLAF